MIVLRTMFWSLDVCMNEISYDVDVAMVPERGRDMIRERYTM